MNKTLISIIILLTCAILVLQAQPPTVAQADQPETTDRLQALAIPPQDIWASTGKLTFLRVHEVGSGFGGPSDFLDAEVVIRLDSDPDKAFGFQLRNDDNRPVRQGMLDLLRDAFNNNWTVTVDYDIVPGNAHGVIIRVALTK